MAAVARSAQAHARARAAARRTGIACTRGSSESKLAAPRLQQLEARRRHARRARTRKSQSPGLAPPRRSAAAGGTNPSTCDRDDERARDGVTPDERDAVPSSASACRPRAKSFEPALVGRRHRQRQQRPRRIGAHGSEVAQVDGERAVTDRLPAACPARKCRPSTSVSVAATSAWPGGGASNAASSPTPSSTSPRGDGRA